MPARANQIATRPVNAASLSGSTENEMIPSIANDIILNSGYLLRPAWRASRLYRSGVCWKPAQLTIPRRKRPRSGMASRTSTTLRSISRKSPVSRGIWVSEKRLITR